MQKLKNLELGLTEAKQKMRELELNIRMKEELIKELVKTGNWLPQNKFGLKMYMNKASISNAELYLIVMFYVCWYVFLIIIFSTNVSSLLSTSHPLEEKPFLSLAVGLLHSN